MSSLEEKIHNAASQNRELLGVLAETDYAPPALEQQQKYINDIDHELKQLESRIRQLTLKREKELKDHEKYRDSVMKRFAYRIGRKTDKFEARAEKEEREYFDALHEEHQAKEHQKSLQSNLSEAQGQKTQLESVAAKHKQAQTDLDNLYDSIFEGPSPGFPEEDEKETAAHNALQSYHDCSVALESEQRALTLLGTARTRMTEALKAMSDARSASQMDMFGGGAMWDMMERNALSRAENLSQEVQMLVMQAQRMSPHVNDVARANIAQGNLMSDVLFDNPFSDHRFHQKIKASQGEMEVSARALEVEVGRTEARITDLRSSLGEESRRLGGARGDLQRARERAFERIAGAMGDMGGKQQVGGMTA